ncbi:MAG: hypothetical protein Q9162_005010 [Coniocarpon cinnabarinum]
MSSSARPNLNRVDSPTPHYQTFPTSPPRNKGRPPQHDATSSPAPRHRQSSSSRPRSSSSSHKHHETPLPTQQLAVLAVVALVEQTALNSIAPYLAAMVASFPDVDPDQVGIYFGLVASSFALAQFATNFFWGWLSDKVGRKPVILLGTTLTAACMIAFGCSRRMWQAMLAQALMGLFNGNQGVVSTCLGEITDRSNQSRAFTYLPVVYGIGGITGPILGGLLISRDVTPEIAQTSYPFLMPNLVAAGLLVIELIITMLFLRESLEELKDRAPLGKRVGNLFVWLWEMTGMSRRPRTKFRHRRAHSHSSKASRSAVTTPMSENPDSDVERPEFFAAGDETGNLQLSDVLNRDVLLILICFTIFQLANIAYSALYPIFAQARQPIGRQLSPEEIGLSLSFAAIITIVFQVGIFGKLRDRLGNKISFRVGLGGFIVAYMLTPWVGYKDGSGGVGNGAHGKLALWAELGVVLIVKTVATVGGLTSALLLITNSARDHTVLGTLNGLAQTLSAAGRAVGPFLAGGLFSLVVKVPKGEAVAFGVFAAVTFVGFLLSLGIKGDKLEEEGWDEEEGLTSDEEGEVEETSESTPLVERRGH